MNVQKNYNLKVNLNSCKQEIEYNSNWSHVYDSDDQSTDSIFDSDSSDSMNTGNNMTQLEQNS